MRYWMLSASAWGAVQAYVYLCERSRHTRAMTQQVRAYEGENGRTTSTICIRTKRQVPKATHSSHHEGRRGAEGIAATRRAHQEMARELQRGHSRLWIANQILDCPGPVPALMYRVGIISNNDDIPTRKVL